MTTLREALKLEGGGVVSLVGAGGKTSLMFKIARELSEAGESVLTTTTTKIFMPSRDQSPQVILTDTAGEILEKSQNLDPANRHCTAASLNSHSAGKLVGYPPAFVDNLWQSGAFRWILVEADGAAGRPLKAPDAHEPVVPECSKWFVAVVGLDSVGKPMTERWVFRHALYAQITGSDPGQPVTAASIANAILHENGMLKGFPAQSNQLLFLNKADLPGGLETAEEIVALLGRQGKTGLKRVVIGNALREPPVVAYYGDL